MDEIILYKSPWKAVKLILLCSIFVFIGIWLITSDQSKDIIGWLSIGFFGLGYPVGLFNLFDRRPQIKINHQGIWDRSTNQNLINWEYILKAYPLNISGQKFIALRLDKNFKIINKQYKWALKMTKNIGAQEVNLSLGSLQKIDMEKFIEFILLMPRLNEKDRKEKIKYVAQYYV